MYVSGYACVNEHIIQLLYDVNNTISSDCDASANSVARDIVSGSSWDQGIASANNTPPTLHVPNPPLPSSQHSLSPHSSTDHCKDNIIDVDSCMYIYLYMFNTGNPRPVELRTSSPTFQHGLDVDPGKVLSSTLVQSGGFFPVLDTSISPITAIATPTESICASHSMYSDMPKQEANNQTPPGTHAMDTYEKVHEHTPSLLYFYTHSLTVHENLLEKLPPQMQVSSCKQPSRKRKRTLASARDAKMRKKLDQDFRSGKQEGIVKIWIQELKLVIIYYNNAFSLHLHRIYRSDKPNICCQANNLLVDRPEAVPRG